MGLFNLVNCPDVSEIVCENMGKTTANTKSTNGVRNLRAVLHSYGDLTCPVH